MAKPFRTPDRADLERILRDEAKAHRISFDTILGTSMRARVVKARRSAICRALAETGCSERGLARVWGLDPSTVSRAARSAGSPRALAYDEATLAHLAWRYGDARTRQIAAGQDPHTQNDIAAWKRLCARGRAA